jgi:hypothetical protein
MVPLGLTKLKVIAMTRNRFSLFYSSPGQNQYAWVRAPAMWWKQT